MRPVIVKAYGALDPAGKEALEAVSAILESWFIDDAAELEGSMLRISFEGDVFPDEEVVQALTPYLCESSWGKLDVMDLEAWTLRRWSFAGGELHANTTTLDKALDSSLL